MNSFNYSNTKPSRIVILGAKGFIAKAIINQLKNQSFNILALSAQDVDLTSDGATAKLAEILNPTDTLVFVSALTPDKGKDLSTMRKNILMAEAVVGAISKKPIQHIVYISSDAVYDDAATLVDESTPLAPNTFHGIMHRAREVALVQACAGANIPLALLRPCAVYGPGDTHNGYGPNRFIRNALTEGGIKLFGGGEEQRDHIYIDDLVRITCHSVMNGGHGVLNIASGTAISFYDVANLAAKAAKRSVDIQTTTRANPITHKHFNISNLTRAIPGFTITSLKEGMELTAKAP